jgi:hypothetical protein
MVYIKTPKPGPRRPRRRTAAQRDLRVSYGLPIPLQPRRPLRLLPPDHPWHGRVPLITGEALRADPELSRAYLWWVLGNMDQWLEDRRVGLTAISGSWIAWLRP